MEKHIVANRMRTPRGVILQSHHRHDYVEVLEDGVLYMVDGGLEYLRRSVVGEDCSVFSDDLFSIVRQHLLWGTYGKKGDQPLKRVALMDMSDDHIIAVLKLHIAPWRKELMEQELEYRSVTNVWLN